ncbi:hypothetical protein AB0A95_30715 [Micromonospora sp. NPDC049230]|uniref:hypothetical protein n=1 Tax=Micromonospora sp. NPDC049230 TaxID=3155502 RepID=UPI003404F457
MRSTCKTATALIIAAVVTWLGTGLFSGQTRTAIVGLAGALTVAALAVNVRQVATGSVRHVTVAVARAPREAYYRGYGDAAQDALGGGDDDQGDTVNLRTIT